MRQRYFRPIRYRLTRPPRAVRNATLDNIAIVPASMLTGTESLKEKVNTVPRRQVILYHTKENTKQKQLLERVRDIFRHLGYGVTLLPVEVGV